MSENQNTPSGNPSTRKAAIKSGASFYFTGKPCKRGHLSVRYTHTSNCRECMFEKVSKDRESISLNRKIAEGKCCPVVYHKFYPADWMSNKNLRRCTMAERGAWMDIMCMLHDSDEHGRLIWTLADLAQAINAPVSLVVELYRKDAFKGVPCKIDAVGGDK